MAAAAFGAFVSPLLVTGLTTLDLLPGRSLLTPPRELELTERLGQLTSSRAQLASAVEAERKRIEHDLHDGAQSPWTCGRSRGLRPWSRRRPTSW